MEGQEAGSVGQVEEGHGEGGGGQHVEDRHPLVWLLAINWKAGKKATALELEMCHFFPFTFIGCKTFQYRLKHKSQIPQKAFLNKSKRVLKTRNTSIGNVYSDKLVLVYGIKFKHN